MSRIKPNKHIKPTPDNRNELVEMIIYGLSQTNDRFETEYLNDIASINKCIREKNTSALGIATGFAFYNLMGKAINLILARDPSGWTLVNQAFSYMYWGWEVQQHDSVRDNITFDYPTQCESSQLITHALSLCSDAEEISNWSACFLHNLIGMGGAEAIGYEDQDLLEFYKRLLTAQLSGQWIRNSDISDNLENYRYLLASTIESEKLNDALVPYCDFRLARAFQFKNMQASKPRRQSDFMFLYEQQWLAIFPFELIALKKIYEKLHGQNLPIEIDHPFMQTALMDIPEINLIDDDLTKSIIRFGESEFGRNWKPLNKIDLLV